MSFYIFIFVVLLYFSFRKYNKYIYWGTILLLSLIAGLRSETIGVDTHAYKDIFIWISNEVLYPIEPAWYFLNKLIAWVGGIFNFLLWITSLLTLIPIGVVSLRCSSNPQMSLFFYYGLYAYINSFNGMRQFVAISFVLLAYSYITQKKNFFLYLLIAFIFHYSAIFSFIAILVDKVSLTKRRVIGGIFSSFFVGMFFNDSMFLVLAGPYAGYLESSEGYRDNFLLAAIMAILMSCLYMCTFFTLRREYKQNLWTKMFFVGIIILNITMRLELGARIILYFTLCQIIFYPMYFRHNIVKNKRMVVLSILLYTSLVFMKILILGNQGEYSVYPYKTILW